MKQIHLKRSSSALIFLAVLAPVCLVRAAPPVVVGANCFDGLHVGLQFDQAVEPASAANAANYLIEVRAPPISVVAARHWPDNRSVTLRLSQEVWDTCFSLLVRGVWNLNGEVARTGWTTPVSNYRAVQIGHPEADPAETGAVGTVWSGRYDLVAAGTGLSGAADDCLFICEPWSEGSVLLYGQVESLEAVNSSSLAGLMVRESLSADSPFCAIVATPPAVPAKDGSGLGVNRVRVLYREAPGDSVKEILPGPQAPAGLPYPNVTLQLFRSGETVSLDFSTNANDFYRVADVSLPGRFSREFFVGIVAASASPAMPAQARFSWGGVLRGDFPPRPTLRVSAVPGGLRFAWEDTSAWRHHLITGDLMTDPWEWESITNQPVRVGTQATLVLPAPELAVQFFALRLSRY